MELLILGALVALALLSSWYGYDSRELKLLDHQGRALRAVRDGDLASYFREIEGVDRARDRVVEKARRSTPTRIEAQPARWETAGER